MGLSVTGPRWARAATSLLRKRRLWQIHEVRGRLLLERPPVDVERCCLFRCPLYCAELNRDGCEHGPMLLTAPGPARSRLRAKGRGTGSSPGSGTAACARPRSRARPRGSRRGGASRFVRRREGPCAATEPGCAPASGRRGRGGWGRARRPGAVGPRVSPGGEGRAPPPFARP